MTPGRVDNLCQKKVSSESDFLQFSDVFFFNFLVFRCFFLKFGKKTFSKPFCFEDIVHDDEILDWVLRKKKNKKKQK